MHARHFPWLTALLLACTASCDSPPDDCEARSIEECASDDRCSEIEGLVYDEPDACWRRAVAGCMPADRGCPTAWGFATGRDGACWGFPDLCIPKQYTEVDGEAPNDGVACNIERFEEQLECPAGD